MQNNHYVIRKSKKAKYLQLRISPRRGLEVIVPLKLLVSPEDIELFLNEKKSWIDKHAKILERNSANTEIQLPEAVFFTVLNEKWQIDYCSSLKKRIELLSFPSNKLVIRGEINDKKRCLAVLKKWIKQKAYQYLQERLTKLSFTTQLTFSTCSVRDMTSRWGSCSSERKINLCTNLIFLPAYLIDHVLLHELCHTKYLSHGKRFWGLLEKLDNSAKKHVLELKEAAKFIPNWVS